MRLTDGHQSLFSFCSPVPLSSPTAPSPFPTSIFSLEPSRSPSPRLNETCRKGFFLPPTETLVACKIDCNPLTPESKLVPLGEGLLDLAPADDDDDEMGRDDFLRGVGREGELALEWVEVGREAERSRTTAGESYGCRSFQCRT